MTELSPVTHVLPLGSRKYGCAGRLIPNTECRVVDVDTGTFRCSGAPLPLLLPVHACVASLLYAPPPRIATTRSCTH
jgi:hypothetical protein